MEKFYIESISTMVRTVSFIGMILGNNYIKIISAFLMILVNVAKIFYEYHKEKQSWTNFVNLLE